MEAVNRTTLGVRITGELQASIDQALILIKRKPGVTDVRWNAASELLLSCCSLGELSPATIARVSTVAREICAQRPRMQLEVEGFGGLPNLIQPRYVYADISGDVQALAETVAQLDRALQPLVPHRDLKPFHAHILLGRLKTESESNRVGLGRALKLSERPHIGTLHVDAIEVLIATSSTSGIGYTVLDRLLLS